jgi:hypothetical protein
MAIKASIEVEVGTLTLEVEAETQALIKALVHLIPHLNIHLSTNNRSKTHLQHSHLKLPFKARMRDLHARSVGRWDTMLLTVTTG